jgi:hypothetical protein
MIMFTRHGQVTRSRALPTSVPRHRSRDCSPGLGAWQRLGERHTAASFTFFRINVPASTFAGTQTITEDIELSHDGNEFTTTGTSQIFPATGPPLDPTCNSLTGTRRD